jgi:hypothetical protein
MTRAIHTVGLACGGHVALRVEGEKHVVILALPRGGRVELRWGLA